VQRDTWRFPDVGFYSAWREPPVGPEKPYPFAPDLAVEVAAPTQYRPAMRAKAERYLAGGAALVWVVWPKRRQVDVWRPGAAPVTLTIGDTLDGEGVVQGFTYPVADLFA